MNLFLQKSFFTSLLLLFIWSADSTAQDSIRNIAENSIWRSLLIRVDWIE
jgi:hypothetical protein